MPALANSEIVRRVEAIIALGRALNAPYQTAVEQAVAEIYAKGRDFVWQNGRIRLVANANIADEAEKIARRYDRDGEHVEYEIRFFLGWRHKWRHC